MTTEQTAIAKAIAALERELQSCIDRLHHAVAASLREDLRQRIDANREAISALRAMPTPENHVKALKKAGHELHAKLLEATDMAVIGHKPDDRWFPSRNKAIKEWEDAMNSTSLPTPESAEPFPVDEVVEMVKEFLASREIIVMRNVGGPLPGDLVWVDLRARLTAKFCKP